MKFLYMFKTTKSFLTISLFFFSTITTAQIQSNSSVGAIERISILNKGSGYVQGNTFLDLSKLGDGKANVKISVIEGYYSYPGRYLNDDGHLSSFNFIQDRDYYQKFSYVVRLSESLEKYRKSMNDLIHPAGTKLYGQYSLVDESGAFRYESGAVNTFSQAGVNTTDIIITFDPADYLESVMNDGNSSISYFRCF